MTKLKCIGQDFHMLGHDRRIGLESNMPCSSGYETFDAFGRHAGRTLAVIGQLASKRLGLG